MGTTTAWLAELVRLYAALQTTYDQPATLARAEQLAELRERIETVKGCVAAAKRFETELGAALVRGR